MSISQLVLISELVMVDRGDYIVKVTAQIDGIILGTALAANSTVEKAEDNARQRVKDLIQSTAPIDTVAPEKQMPTAQSQPKPTTTTPVKVTRQALRDFEPANSQPNPQTSFEPEEEQNRIAQLDTVIPTQKQEGESSSADTANTILPKPMAIDNSSVTPIDLTDDRRSSASEDITLEEEDKINLQPELNFSTNQSDDLTPINDDSLVQNNTATNGTDSSNNSEDNKPVIEPEKNTPEPVEAPATLDFRQIIDRTTIEIKRLGWTQEDGKKYLLANYGKKSRQILTDDELIEFLQYLQQQPTPE